MDSNNTTSSFLKKIRKIYSTLSPEKVLVVWGSLLVSACFFAAALIVINARFVMTIPTRGGELHEGLVGTPRFINPVLATSPQDKDLTALIYAGLTKRDKNGVYVPDIAETIEKSEDGLHYSITLKPIARFHDGEKVTADDILYTISLIQNPRIKSPHFIEWEAVTAEKISDTEINISLKQPFPLFMEALSIGILPKHLWKNLNEEQVSLSDYNIHAVGAGPFAIGNIDTISGIPVQFNLTSHKYYTLGRPYLDGILISMFDSDKALINAYNNGTIERVYGLAPDELSQVTKLSKSTIATSRLPRVFSIFLNPNKAEFLSDKNVRKALSLAIDRTAIIDTVYKGYALSLSDPFPFDSAEGGDPRTASTTTLDDAKALLATSKYFKNASSTHEITLTTTNSTELRNVAEMVKKNWESLGITTHVLVYEPSDINQSVIKERDFQALLYGSLINHPSDLFAFFHSSQRAYPGLNISGYVSAKLDKALSALRTAESGGESIPEYDDVKKEFQEETPGIFMYSPTLLYVSDDGAETPLATSLLDTSERFALSYTWYRNKERVWRGTYYKNAITKIENILH